MRLLLKNLLFTAVASGTVAIVVPMLLVRDGSAGSPPWQTLSGIVFLTGSAIYALCVGTCFHLFILFYEEPHLEKQFGSSYRQYRARVSRWLPRPNASSQRRSPTNEDRP